jgi:hypothetical protein
MTEFEITGIIETGEIVVHRNEDGEVLVSCKRDHPDHRIHHLKFSTKNAMKVAAAILDVALMTDRTVHFKPDGTEYRYQ